MAIPLEQFVKQLEDSGVIASETLRDFVPPKSSPKDAEELARELVRQKKLTKFQAELIWLGQGKSLVLGNYLLLDKIGAGGMGQVFKAQHRVMERIVALKVLPPSKTKDRDTVQRFHREVKAAARLEHPNIVTAFDADQSQGVHFLVMQYVEGSDLSVLVKKNGPFPVSQAVNYILQAARGLEFAHKKGVVHRDIKPSNLLVDTEGTVKVLDMGLARIEQGDNPAQAELTGSGAVMGTVDFMAPEQALSSKHADARADMYSLGCTLYFLLTGKAIYDGESLMAKLLAHRDLPIPTLGAILPDVPESVESVFRKMVAKRIEDRYQSMTEVIVDLKKCGGEHAANTSLSFASSNPGLTNFLKEISEASRAAAVSEPVTPAKDILQYKNRLMLGSGLLILLAGIILSLRSKDGTLIVNVNEPDVEVQILNEDGKVEITRKGDKSPITISVDPGKHRLTVQKNEFYLFAEEFVIEAAGKKSITATLMAKKPALEKWYTNGLGMKFVLVGKGTAWLGGGGGQQGTTQVDIPHDFYLGMYEVTQEQWKQVTGQTPSQFSWSGTGGNDFQGIYSDEIKYFPVEMISWDDAQLFLKRLNKREKEAGWVYRLPTEAEWEYACRGGPLSDRLNSAYDYYFDEPTNVLLPAQANFADEKGLNRPCRVGSYQPNQLGLYDMHGNVGEWCDDEEKVAGSESQRVDRSGYWNYGVGCCRAVYRYARSPSERHGNIGLRIARVPVGMSGK